MVIVVYWPDFQEGLADSDKVNFLKKESPEMINIITEFKVYFNDVIISEASIKEIRLRLIPIIEYTKSNKNISKEVNFLSFNKILRP